MPVIRARAGVWCDYCKVRFSRELLADKAASWTVVSESQARRGLERHYCQSCAEIASTWNDGTTWELQEQIDYACREERL